LSKFNIVFATDEGYLQHLAVALQSLLVNNEDLDFNIYIINGGINEQKFSKLTSITAKYRCQLINIEINDALFEGLVRNHHFTKANYYRLLIPNFVDQDKVLYLDSDIVVNGSVKELYSCDFKDDYLGAVLNPGFDRHKKLGMDVNSQYFNSGVMLINNIKWKEDKITEKVIEFVTDNSDVIEFVDQCGLNAVIDGKWTAMDLKFNQQAVIFLPDFVLKYNCFGIQELVEAKRNPVIVHYTGSSKPWQFPNKHPLKHLYWQYLSMTPFKRYFPDELTMVNVIKSIIPHQLKSFIHRRLKA
jgi:lipopolysaccharide biosynthesis glycosyltransferase